MTRQDPRGQYQRVPLGRVLETLPVGKTLQQGWSPQCLSEPAADESWGVLKTTAIQPGRFLDEHNKALPEHMEPRPALEVRPGDLLLTNAGPRSRCAIPCLVRSTRPRLMLSGKVYRFRADRDVMDPRFLELYLLSAEAQADLDARKTGISDSGLNLTRSRFLEMNVPCPGVGEQHRIVEVLEDHLSRLDAAQQELSTAKSKAKAWADGLADEALYGRSHPLRRVGDLLREGLRNGHSAPASQTGIEGLRTLTLTAVTRSEFSDRYTKLTSAEPHKVADLWLKAGDILVQRSNTPDLVGSAALYSGPDDWAIFPDLMIRLRCDPDQVSPQYLITALRAERTHRLLRSKAKGLAGSMPKIDQSAIASLQVPVPASPAERERVTAAVVNAESTQLRLDVAIDSAARRGLRLSQALLSAAFSGRLTHRDNIDKFEEMADG